MSEESLDLKLIAAIRRRLAEESEELHNAVIAQDRAQILDEVVDVMYYLRRLAATASISEECITRYSLVKSSLREAGMRSKSLEMRLAAELVDETITTQELQNER